MRSTWRSNWEDDLWKSIQDWPEFCRHFIRIKVKGVKGVEPMVLNYPQRRMHKAYLRQMEELRYVRQLHLKARQVGMSTGSAALFYWLCMLHSDFRVYTRANDDPTAIRLHDMVIGFDENAPLPINRIKRSSDHKIVFANGSSFEFGTGSTATGTRGGTFQAQWFSELAFWDSAEENIAASDIQLPDAPGTVAIYESTANGASGPFYELWRAAVARQIDFVPIFTPWHKLPEYQRNFSGTFHPSMEKPTEDTLSEKDYMEKHQLSPGQMVWRRRRIAKNSSLGAAAYMLFAQEYPASADEAFQFSGGGCYFSPRHVKLAMQRNPHDHNPHEYPGILGVDPAPAHGESATAIIRRRGTVVSDLIRLRGLERDAQHVKIQDVAEKLRVSAVWIDGSDGFGRELFHDLRRTMPAEVDVRCVVFGEASTRPELYANKRAEMAGRATSWLAGDVCLPNEPRRPGQPNLEDELLCFEALPNEARLQLKPKKEFTEGAMGSKGIQRSPDGADAFLCTFAFPEPSGQPDQFYVADTNFHPGTMESNVPRFDPRTYFQV